MITKEFADSLGGLVFPRKLWTLANCDAVVSIRWARQGTTVQIDSVLVVEECFIPNVFNVKSNQHVLRQMSYYNFQKIDRKSKVWEFRHDYFQAGREDLLHLVKRQPQGVPKKYAQDFERRCSSRIQSQSPRVSYANLDPNLSDRMEEDNSEEGRTIDNDIQHPRRKSSTKSANCDIKSGKKPPFGQKLDKHSPLQDDKSCSLSEGGESRCKAIKRGRRGRRKYRKYQGRRQKYVPLLPKLSFVFSKSRDEHKSNFPQSIADGQRSQNLFVNPDHGYVKSNNALFDINNKNGPVHQVPNMALGEDSQTNVNDQVWLHSHLLNDTNSGSKMEEINNKMQSNANTFHSIDIPGFNDLLEDNKDEIRYLIESTERALNARHGDLVDQNDISYSNVNTEFQQNQNNKWNPPELFLNVNRRLTKYMTSDSGGCYSNDFELPQNICINPAFFKEYVHDASRTPFSEPGIRTEPNSGKQYANLEPSNNASCISTNDVYVSGGKMRDSLCNGSPEVPYPVNEGRRFTDNVPYMTELLEVSEPPSCATSLANHTLLPSEQAGSTIAIPSPNCIELDHNYNDGKKFDQNELLELNFDREENSPLSIEPTLRPEGRESTLLSSFIEGDSVSDHDSGEVYIIGFPEHSLGLKNTSAQSSYSPENEVSEVQFRQIFKSEPGEENGESENQKFILSNTSNTWNAERRLLSHPANRTVPRVGCSGANLCKTLQLNYTNDDAGSFGNDSKSENFYQNSENYDSRTVREQFNSLVSSHETQESIISNNGIEIKLSLDGFFELTSVVEFLNNQSENGKKYDLDLKDERDIVIKNCGEDFSFWKVKKLLQSVHL